MISVEASKVKVSDSAAKSKSFSNHGADHRNLQNHKVNSDTIVALEKWEGYTSSTFAVLHLSPPLLLGTKSTASKQTIYVCPLMGKTCYLFLDS